MNLGNKDSVLVNIQETGANSLPGLTGDVAGAASNALTGDVAGAASNFLEGDHAKDLSDATDILETLERWNIYYNFDSDDIRELSSAIDDFFHNVSGKINDFQKRIQAAEKFPENAEAVKLLEERLAVLLPKIALKNASLTLTLLEKYQNNRVNPYTLLQYDESDDYFNNIKGAIENSQTRIQAAEQFPENAEAVNSLKERLAKLVPEIALKNAKDTLTMIEKYHDNSAWPHFRNPDSIEFHKWYLKAAEQFPENADAVKLLEARLAKLLPEIPLSFVTGKLNTFEEDGSPILLENLKLDIEAADKFPENAEAVKLLKARLAKLLPKIVLSIAQKGIEYFDQNPKGSKYYTITNAQEEIEAADKFPENAEAVKQLEERLKSIMEA